MTVERIVSSGLNDSPTILAVTVCLACDRMARSYNPRLVFRGRMFGAALRTIS